MNHKSTAKCNCGNEFEWGPCKSLKKKLFGGTKICGCKLFDQIYADGSVASVSLDDEPFEAVRCQDCGAVSSNTSCPKCGAEVPVSAFRKKGLFSKLG